MAHLSSADVPEEKNYTRKNALLKEQQRGGDGEKSTYLHQLHEISWSAQGDSQNWSTDWIPEQNFQYVSNRAPNPRGENWCDIPC